jgi:long-chain acyl-CoA synthetase
VQCIEQIIYLDKRGMRKYDHPHELAADVQAEGRAGASAVRGRTGRRIGRADLGHTCVMLYTSGTTGKPKGVVLSNRNIIETAKASAEFDTAAAGRRVLAYLPMAWVGDFIFSIGQAYWTGFCVNCPESPETMMTDLREIGPTYFFAPPRIFETHADAGDDPDGGCRPAEEMAVRSLHGARAQGRPAILDGKPVGGTWDRLKYRWGTCWSTGR